MTTSPSDDLADMTWKDFKEAVDKKLAESGAGEDVQVWYIIVSCPNPKYVEIGFDECLGLSVCS